MGYALKIYEAFRDLGDDKASILAEFVEYVESRKAATSEELRETELRLQAQIEETRKEIKEVELRLQTQIEETRKELKEVELRLQAQIEETRKEMKEIELRLQSQIKEVELKLTREINETKASLVKWMFLFWVGQVTAIASILIWLLR